MFGIRRETVERLRREYPVGCRVELVQMDDVQAPPIGTKGNGQRCRRYRQHHGQMGQRL